MKPKVLVLPLVALVGASIWLVRQRGEIADVHKKIGAVRTHIATAGGNISDGSSSERPAATRTAPSGKSSISWQRLAELTHERSQGIFARQEMLRAEMKIHAMTPAELVAALGEIDALGLDVRTAGDLTEKIIEALGKKDPGAALDYLTDGKLRLGLRGRIMEDILSNWMKKDMGAAIGWLDGRIASGALDSKALDGKSYQRIGLEAILLSQLITSDPASASRRLLALPENQRFDVFSGLTQIRRDEKAFSESDLAAYISLVRGTLATNAQSAVITKPVARIAQQPGYDKIDQYLESVTATPDERTTAVREAGETKFRFLANENRLNVETVDTFRQWAAKQSPDSVDQITAAALAGVSLNGANAFDRAADLASHYHDRTGNDQILIRFLGNGYNNGNKEKARTLAGKISDAAVRQRILDQIK